MVDFLFYTLLVLLPTQLGKHFWPKFALASGIRVDYLSPTIYLTDVILVCLFLSWYITNARKIKDKKTRLARFFRNIKIKYFPNALAIGTLLVIGVLNVVLAKNSAVALYKLVKISEFVLFSFYIAKNVTSLIQVQRIFLILIVCGLYESLIALAQFLVQSSLSSFYSITCPFISFGLWFLGERTFNSITLGIAQAVLNGKLFLRPYATFPHPNVLAGFIVVVLALVSGVRNWELKVSRKKVYHSLFIILYSLFFILSFSALFITFSRSAWIVGALVLTVTFIVRYFKALKKTPTFILGFFLFVSLFLILFHSYILPRFISLKMEDGLSVVRRIELNKTALRMIKAHPFLGVGLGNFIVRIFEFSRNKETIYWLQPVHNIFLLVAAESGLLGLGLFLWLLLVTYKRLLSQFSIFAPSPKLWSVGDNFQFSIALSTILFLGLFDHYWLTLQQTQLLFSLVLGLCWAKIES